METIEWNGWEEMTDFQKERLQGLLLSYLKGQEDVGLKVAISSVHEAVVELMHEAYKMGWQEGH